VTVTTEAKERDSYLTTEEVAALTHTNIDTVRYWRHKGDGPKGFKVGRRVLYSANEVHDWLASMRAGAAAAP
jgi:excisionase family DNA binding protein